MSTLSTLLSERAQTHGARVALSFKERAAWRQLDWSQVELATSSLRGALGDAGFGAGAVLFVSKRASVHTVLAVRAALSLGGTVLEVGELLRATKSTEPRWAFAHNSAEFLSLLEAGAAAVLSGVLLDDRRGASLTRSTLPVLSCSALVATESSTREPVFATERCVLEISLARDSEAKQLLTSWLTQGFELGVSEESESIERDAGELGVSLRIASSRSWDAWADALRARFAAPGSRKRRFVEWALAVNSQPLARSHVARWVAALLVVVPLRRALRLRRWHRAASLDAGPSPETALLLAGLGVRLEPCEGIIARAFEEPVVVTATPTAPSPSVNEFAQSA